MANAHFLSGSMTPAARRVCVALLLLTVCAFLPIRGMQDQKHGRRAEAHEADKDHTDTGDTHADHDDEQDHGHAEDAGAHADEDGHEDASGTVVLAAEQRTGLNLSAVPVRPGTLTAQLRFPAEVDFDPLRVAHLTPRVSGVVRDVRHTLGDRVAKGALLAVIESRELGEAQSSYLAALARRELHRKIYEREESLWKKGITAELQYLEAVQEWEEGRIEVRRTRQALLSLGIEEAALDALPDLEDVHLNRYTMVMPFDGYIIEQHLTRGEVAAIGDTAFAVADTGRMWVTARVPERDLSKLRPGLEAAVVLDGLPGETFRGVVDYVSPGLDRETRTAAARMVLDNPDGRLRAGMYGTVVVAVPGQDAAGTWLVPASALQRRDDADLVFKQLSEDRYVLVPVAVRARSAELAEVTGDLRAGDMVAAGDTFILKSLAGTSEMGHGHSH